MQVITGKVQKAKKVVIYGPEGVGKSSLAAQFPRPIFIDTEGSTTEMDVARLPKPSSWEMLKQQVKWVWQGGQYGTLIIDTIDWAEMLCVESVCSTHQKNGIEDFGYGKGYIFVSEELGRMLNLLSDVVDAGIHVVLIAHAQIVKFEQPDEMGAYDRYQLKLGQKTASRTAPLVKEWADMVLFINYKTFSIATDKEGKKNKAQGGVRTVYATHHPAWDAKNRHGLPDEFPLDYGHIAHIFNTPAPTTNPSQQQQASVTPPQQSAQTVNQTGNIPNNIPAPVNTAPPTPSLNSNIPPALRELMTLHQVTESEIQQAVFQRNYYPVDTPIANYDPGFVEGVLVAAWSSVLGMIQNNRKAVPFN
ncbi:ATP-binding protein [Paenibacillus riograndensis]|uniref:Phage protein n=1 Tax=Paenibacillus riograndensis SBR5 TaxID=1073571 RepID=A0A0E3WFZ4_9BACL|nr:ATP-binding protein [Paenibacillus riograndensis]CQR51442.1 phage protein [Paenibacillus riograndensis SBR5]